jgi:hypothetical protein
MTDAEKVAEIRDLFEWDWAYTLRGERLHHLKSLSDPLEAYDARRGPAVSTCGVPGIFAVPGLLSRMGMQRCAHCCDRLGIARGLGSPNNDQALRPWVEARIADFVMERGESE